MGLSRSAHGWGAKRPDISYKDETWYSYTLPKEDPEYIQIT